MIKTLKIRTFYLLICKIHACLCCCFAVQPEPPRNLAITNIQATSVLLQFVPGFNGYTSISKWVVQAQINEVEDWVDIFEKSAPDANSIVVENLTPYMDYRLRMMAENVAGRSKSSELTRRFQTIQAPPSSPPPEVTVRAVNETAIRVRWKVRCMKYITMFAIRIHVTLSSRKSLLL